MQLHGTYPPQADGFAKEVPFWISLVIPFLNIEPACQQAGVEQVTLKTEVS